MKPSALLALASVALMAGTALAAPHGGIDLSVGACPDNPGASPSGTLDCAAGNTLAILATWAPDVDIQQLAGIEGRIFVEVGGDLETTASFWNFNSLDPPAGCGRDNLSLSEIRPSGCDAPEYLDAWNVPGSLHDIAAAQRSPQQLEIAFAASRPSGIAVTQGQRVFGAQLLVALHADGENGCAGCQLPVCVYWHVGRPGSWDANEDARLDWMSAPTGYGASQGISFAVGLNGGTGLCSAVPARRTTWGQLKTLYR